MTSLEKLEAMAKFNRLQTLKKLIAYSFIAMIFSFLLNFKALAEGLWFVFVNLGNWSWLSNSRFLILLLNITIVTLTTKSRLLTAQPNTRNELHDLYDDLVEKNKPRLRAVKEIEDKLSPQATEFSGDQAVDNLCSRTNKPEEDCCCGENIPAVEVISTESIESVPVVKSVCPAEVESDGNTMSTTVEESDEELQRRADDFIAKFRSQIRKGM
ncbi:hypothetical protein SUGI_1187350 [Cryptomeria japonica]|nr:hypothetical protein SUGI_1187350 [Cryptomeria japonica]